MSILDFFRHRRRSSSASVAKDRLQIVLSHERMSRDSEEFLPRLQRDILAVVARYADIDPDKTVVRLDRGVDVSTLEIEIELPARIKAVAQ